MMGLDRAALQGFLHGDVMDELHDEVVKPTADRYHHGAGEDTGALRASIEIIRTAPDTWTIHSGSLAVVEDPDAEYDSYAFWHEFGNSRVKPNPAFRAALNAAEVAG